MDLRLTFNEDEANYDKWRPTYPKELFEEIFKYSQISRSGHAVEVGIGTGQATNPFLQAGIRVTAVEYGEKLAAYCRQKFSDKENFQVVCGKFEEFEPIESCDLIYSAIAFHWIDTQIGYQKAYQMLKENGTIALFWNRPFVGIPGNPLDRKIQRIYQTYRPDGAGKSQQQTPYRDRHEQLVRAGFQQVKTQLFFATRVFSANDYIGLLRTYSDHRALEASVREKFEQEIIRAIEEEGGVVKIYDTIDLHLGKKLESVHE